MDFSPFFLIQRRNPVPDLLRFIEILVNLYLFFFFFTEGNVISFEQDLNEIANILPRSRITALAFCT